MGVPHSKRPEEHSWQVNYDPEEYNRVTDPIESQKSGITLISFYGVRAIKFTQNPEYVNVMKQLRQ